MADLDRLYSALKAADAAGNTADATALAQAIRTASAPATTTGPQPSFMDRVVGTVGRPIHDVLGAMVGGALNGPLSAAATAANAMPGNNATMAGTQLPKQPPINPQDVFGLEASYQNSLSRNRNAPGYAAARAVADKAIPLDSSGLTDQLVAPFLPTMAGAAGMFGGIDSANAMADAQGASQGDYQTRHPILSAGANLVGSALMGAPEGTAARLPVLAGDNALITRAVNPKAMGPFPMRAKPDTAPSVAELKAASRDAYRAVDDAGVRVSNDAMNYLGDSVQDRFGARLDPTLHPDATAAYNRIMHHATDGAKGGESISFSELDNLRRVVNDAAQATKPADKALARMMVDHIDDFVNRLGSEHLDTTLQDQLRASLQSATSAKGQVAKQIKAIERTKPGALAARGAAGADTRAAYMDLHEQLPQAEAARQSALGDFNAETDLINAGPQQTVEALNRARNMWARASQADIIQRQIDKAAIQATANYSQSGFENALRQRFKSLALNDRAMARLSPEVRKAVIDVAKGSKMGNLLRNIGKYAPHGPVATTAGAVIGGGAGAALGGMMGIAEGGGIGALAVPAIGEMARAGATARTVSAANQARDIAALGRLPTVTRTPALQLPSIPPNSSLPYPILQMLPMGSGVRR